MIESPQPVAAPSGARATVPNTPESSGGNRTSSEDPLLFIARVGDVLAASLDLDVTLDRLVQLMVPSLADVCFVHLLDEESRFQRVAMRASSQHAAALGAQIEGMYFDQGRAVNPMHEILAGGKARLHAPVTVASLSHLMEPAVASQLLHDLAITSVLVVPLVAQGRPLGVLGLATTDQPAFSEGHRRLGEEIGRRAAVAIDHARLYQAASASQRAAEFARARASFLAEASAALASSLDVRTTLRTVVKLAVPLMADVCSVALAEPDGTLRRVAIAHADPERQRFIDGHSDIIPTGADGPHPAAMVMATGEPYRDNAVTAEAEAQYAHGAYLSFLRGLSIRAKLVVPLEAHGRCIGTVMLATSEPGRTFNADDVTLWSDLARRAALAIDHARLYREACEAKDRLVAQHNLSEAIVHTIAEGILVAGRDGVLTYVNPSVARILGWTAEQLVGRRVHDILHVQDAAGTPFPRAECPVAGIYDTGQRVQLNDEYFVRADGVVIPVAVTASPLVQDGRIVGGVTVFRDNSVPRRQSEELRRSEERLRRALTSAGMVMWERDFATGRTYRTDNAAALYGRPNTELIDDPLHYGRLIHPDDREAAIARAEAAIELGEVYDIEYRAIWPNGNVRWLSGRARIFTDEHGVPRGMSGTTHDITDRKEAQNALQRLLDERQAEAEELRLVHRRLQRSLAALLGLHDVGKLLTSVADLNATGRRLLEIAMRAANLRAVALHRRGTADRLRLWHRAGATPETHAARKSSVVTEGRRHTLKTGLPTVGTLDATGDGTALTAWCLPLLAKGKVIGVLEALGEPRPADDLTEDILGSIALQAATALENVRLYREVADSEQALRRLVHQLMTAQEDERRRIANDIHDGFAQLALGVQQVMEAYAHEFPGGSHDARKRLDVAIGLAGRTVSEIRRVLADLRPSVLEDFGLERALRAHAASLEAEGLHVAYSSQIGALRLAGDIEIALFRVAQEALTNVRKHASVTQADLRFLRCGADLVLEIQDDGQGFDPAAAGSGGPGEHLGLLSMSERIAQVAGTLAIISERGGGTLVRAIVPLARATERYASRRTDQ
jgi:PAS domain S-box-containing protein